MQKQVILSFLAVIVLLTGACKPKDRSSGPDLSIIRFDQILMNLDSNNIAEAFLKVRQSYPDFVDIYFSEVLPLPGYESGSDSFYIELKKFISDPKIREIYELVQQTYPDLKNEEAALSEAFERSKNWFPGVDNPRLYSFISEFSFQRFIFQDGEKEGLALGLDMFLDPVFDYSQLESGTNMFSYYLTRNYDREHLVKKTVESWIEDKMGASGGNRLIDDMLFEGKKLYVLEQLTEIPDSILLEYTSEQTEWLESNEKEMWAFYLQNDWFYTTDQYVIKRLTFPAPNTMALGMPAAAPGRTGVYLGWKIVRSYMKRYPETGWEELLSMDAQRLLEQSRFKPGMN